VEVGVEIDTGGGSDGDEGRDGDYDGGRSCSGFI
jgi:hypothetical protein